MLKKVQIFKALDIEIKKQKGPASVKDAYKGHHSLKEELSQPGISVIAEVAGGSPLRGQVRDNYRPSTHARSLLENGARAISVATDRFLFWGDDRHLPEVRAQAKVPLLRRDFIFEEYQIEESKILGADAIYLMACLLEPERLRDLHKLAMAKALDVVFEIFEEADLKRALEAGAEIVCVVGRDMDTWEPSFEKALELVKKVPEDKCFRVVEAGITTQAQIQQLEDLGVQGVILGEVFLDEFYPGKRLAQILAGIEPSRKVPKIKPKLEESVANLDTLEAALIQEDAKKAPPKKAKGGEKAAKPVGKGSEKPATAKEEKKPKTPAEKPDKEIKPGKTSGAEKKHTAEAGKKPTTEGAKKKAPAKAPAESAPAKKPAAKKASESTEPAKPVSAKKVTEKAEPATKAKALSESPKKAEAKPTKSPVKKGDETVKAKDAPKIKAPAKAAEKKPEPKKKDDPKTAQKN